MLTDKITKHPGLIFAEDLKHICKPLQTLNITYFSHVFVDAQGEFSGISNNANFHENYLKNAYYNADIHLAKLDLGKMVIWDTIPLIGESALLYQESISFGVNHTFTIIDEDLSGKNYYHFASNTMDNSINQVYLSNIDLLHNFIQYFKSAVYTSRELSLIHKIKFSIDKDHNGYTLANDQLFETDHAGFLNKINSHNLLNRGSRLTPREIEIMGWLHFGKTCVEIAEILGIAQITVHKHISNIKEKTQCYTFFQLGELFTKLKTNLNRHK